MRTNTENKPSIPRNMAWLAWSGAISIANSVVLWMALARWRDASVVGQFSTVMSVYTIFLTLCSLGLSPYLAGEIARRERRGPFVASATVLIAGWSLVCIALMAAAGTLANQSPEARSATAILSLAMLPTGLIGVGEAIFTALGRARAIALATTVENLLRTAIPLYLLHRGHSLPVICLSFVAIRVMTCVVYAIVARGHLGLLRSASRPILAEIAKVAPTFAGLTILAAFHWQIGTVLVNRLGGETAAAEFGVASRFLIPVTILLWSYVSVLQPAASRLAAESHAKLGDFLSRGLRIVLALGLLVAAGGMLLGRNLLVLLFGARYAGASVALGLLSLSVIPFGVVMLASRGLIATGRQRVDLIANLAAVATNIAGNIALIPRHGAAGAAAAQLLSITVMAAVEVVYGTRPLFRLHLNPARRNVPACRNVVEVDRPRVLMIGAHPTKTLGGISTLIRDILHSPLAREFEIRHVVSQMDECGKLGKLVLAIEAIVQFSVHLLGWRPGLVYVHIGGNSSLYRKTVFIALARLTGHRVLAHFHAGNFEPYFAGQGELGRKLILRGLGLSSKFIAVSHEMARLLGVHWPEAEIAVVPNGIHTRLFADARTEVRATQDDVRLLFVGKMGFLKGEEDLIDALRRIASESQPRLRVDMLGQLSGTIEGFCRESGLRPMIDRLGPVPLDERIAFFKRADIFVLPTYAEGLPIAVIEAMAAGLPVISTPVGGIPELVDDGVEGYLIEPGDVEALADRIARLVNDPARRRAIGQRAQVKARQFDWSIVLAQLGTELRAINENHPDPMATVAQTVEFAPLDKGAIDETEASCQMLYSFDQSPIEETAQTRQFALPFPRSTNVE